MRQRTATLTFALAFALLVAAPVVARDQARTTGVVASHEDIVFPELPAVEMPQPQRFELDNGMIVLISEDHELPLIEARAYIRTGSRLEPDDMVGVAQLTGNVMRSGGTTSLASDDLDDRLEALAGSIETSIQTSFGLAFMSCLVADFDDVLALFADVLRNPAFEEDKLEVAKTGVRGSIARQNDSPAGILGREFQEVLYGSDSPYARGETYASIDRITREDLAAWHAKYYHPNNILLGLVGDFDTQEVLAKVKATFGDWQRGPAAQAPAAPSLVPKPGVYFVEKNDLTQSSIRIGHPGVLRDNPDYYAIEVMNQVLSGGFGSRLFSNVRSKKGLAYSVFGGVGSQWDYPGLTSMTMVTKAETTGAGLEALIEEAHKIRETEPPTEEEVAKAKQGILSSFVFTADSVSEILSQQLSFAYYGFPSDWLERYRKGIDAVTVEETRKAAVDYIHPEQFSIMVVGPREGQDRPLEDFGTVHDVDITIPEPEVETVAETAEGKAKGMALVAKAVEGVGGAEALDGLAAMRRNGTAAITTPQGELDISSTTLMVFPGRMRQELTLPFGTIVQVLDGDTAWAQTPQGTQALPEAQRNQLASSMARSLTVLLRARGAEGFSAVAAGTDTIGETAVELVQVTHGEQTTTLGVDPQTGRVLTVRFRGTNNAGVPGQMQQTYSDFRDVDGGMVLPFASETTFDGEPMARATIEAIALDPEADEALFTQPE